MAQPMSILYVEDDAMSREIMRLMLVHEMGVEHVTLLDDSSNFLARVRTLTPQPALVLLDIHVRPLDGFEMLALLRALPEFAQVPVVALTASVMNEEVQRLKHAGFDGVLAKPINQDTFADAIHRIIHGEKLWRVMN